MLNFSSSRKQIRTRTRRKRPSKSETTPFVSVPYFVDYRENKNVLEVAKIAGEEWKNMTEKQKGPYEKIAKKNKEKRKRKQRNIIKKTKEQRQKKQQQNVDPNKPKKPASSFLLFSKETRQSLVHENPGINSSTLTAMISVKWKELDQEEKQNLELQSCRSHGSIQEGIGGVQQICCCCNLD
ncbi:hypothetical protein OIU84_022141 [Salix udensis]|uniref:HMG box domain-containing protein n=1 Tax=Salix udensis TaxID=889485 RepID=A0AAD6KN07_9ROSI|nr:hypothetical protein OIU84_022141 [Salix udensis]